MKVARHPVANALRARAAFVETRGAENEAKRAAEIAALPSKVWKGRTLYALQCHGESGRGPHVQYVHEGLLWALIELNQFICPFHR